MSIIINTDTWNTTTFPFLLYAIACLLEEGNVFSLADSETKLEVVAKDNIYPLGLCY